MRLTTHLHLGLLAQRIVNSLPDAVVFPVPEVIVRQAPGWQVMGQGSPRVAVAGDIEDGVDDPAPCIVGRSTVWFGGRYEWFQHLPLRIAQVGRIEYAATHAAILGKP